MTRLRIWLARLLLRRIAVSCSVPGMPVWFIDVQRIDQWEFSESGLPGYMIGVRGLGGRPVQDAVACYSLEPRTK